MKHIKKCKLPKVLFISLCLIVSVLISVSAQSIEIKNGSYYINGEKFFVKGIGFEVGALPGQLPWQKTFNPEQLHFDIKRIISGGFNTIRTWSSFSEEELEVLKNYDIKIIMGIWVDPHGDFADPEFVNSAKIIVNDVLEYSKNYDNIIGYLIMNEPQPEAIFNAGYENSSGLWTDLIDIIHIQHPNIPVSIANTSNGTYIESSLFDFSAYNTYIYNPVTVNYLHGYRAYVNYLQKLNQPNSPLIITEYGLSVSPSGEGPWGYGGNTISEQKDGLLHMYKSLVDGGANGSCVFIYSDGWWKAGNEFVHDDNAEEWFGFIEYESLDDTIGIKRPVWQAVCDYQSVIITEPRGGEIYSNKVPVEMFLNDTITRVDVLLDDTILSTYPSNDRIVNDTLLFDTNIKRDMLLVFKCYDAMGNLIKIEDKNILVSKTALTIPAIEVEITNEDFWDSGQATVSYHVTKSSDFEYSEELRHIYYPHIGFSYGEKYSATIPSDNEFEITATHSIGNNVDVITLGASFDVSFGNFTKRIVSEVTEVRTKKDISIYAKNVLENGRLRIYPNPTNGTFNIFLDHNTEQNTLVNIFNSQGTCIYSSYMKFNNTPLSINSLEGKASGVYYLTIFNEELYELKKIVLY